MIDNGIVTLHDLVEIDTKNISLSAMLQLLRLALSQTQENSLYE